MDKYRNFLVEDFLNDEFFIDWIKNPGPENNAFWQNWLLLHPEKENPVQQARTIISAFDFTEPDLPESFYERLKVRIDNSITNSTDRKTRWLNPAAFLKAAAAFLGAAALGALAWYYSGRATYITGSSRYAETKIILLPDSSEVTLNAHSSIRYASNWSNAHRELWLNGEGFFKVRHIENRKGTAEKFIVHAGALNVEVLGTRFNIKTSTGGTDVLLTSGSVRCAPKDNNNAAKIIKPNDLCSLSDRGNITVKQVDPAAYTAWMDHKYIFDKIQLKEICRHLGQYLGHAIIIEDEEAASQKLSGTLELGSEETLMKTLSVLLKSTVKKERDRIIIYAK